ncbi:uncharacterized protein LOC114723372 [Neltuma alba]|uniref:uncharacterized protein LOC114723372 n=1 Tax=Neltuma alba TaxID=207710 RepID=UPI0010A4188E|nr:uncharacterized protein LOC114723372 [Prosopis alba]
MESMTVLKADHTAITVIPKSLARLEALKHGYVSFLGLEGRARDVFPSLIWSWMSPADIPQSSSEEFLLSMSSLVFSVIQNGRFHGLSPFLGDLAKLRGVWEECRSQSRFDGEMARLLDALYGTNFMELESTPSRSVEASTSFDGHDQVQNATSVDSLNSLLIQMAGSCKVDLLKDKILQVCLCFLFYHHHVWKHWFSGVPDSYQYCMHEKSIVSLTNSDYLTDAILLPTSLMSML